MAFNAVPDGALAVVKFTHGAEQFSNHFWFTKEGFTYGDQQDLATVMDTGFGGPMKALMADTCGYQSVKVYDMRSADGPFVLENGSAGAGALSTQAMPVSDAVLISLYSANRGRSGRGRLFVSGLTEVNWDGGGFLTTAIDEIIDLLTDIRAAASAIGFTWVIVSRWLDKVARDEPLAQPVESWVCRNAKPGIQRKRLDRP